MRRSTRANANRRRAAFQLLCADHFVILVEQGVQFLFGAAEETDCCHAQRRELQNKDVVAFVSRSAQLRRHLFSQQFYQRGITVWMHDVIADRSLDKSVKRGSRFAFVGEFENTRALAQRQA